MLKLRLTSDIRVRRTKRTEIIERFVESCLVFENPSYKSAVDYGNQSTYAVSQYIPRHINAYWYDEDEKYLYISRGFLSALVKFLDKRKIKYKVIDHTVTNLSGLELKRIPTLRDYQVRATNKAIRQSGGVIKMPCGAGKTITLTNVIRRLQQHTLVLVHTNFIMNQWVQYFKKEYNYNPGIIQGKTWDVKEITIAMMPTLYQRILDETFLKQWGCVVVDETHRVPAETFFSVVNQFPAKYRFGTTATARRNDGLTNMIFATIGEIVYTIKAKTLAKKNFLTIPSIKLVQTAFYHDSNNYHKLISQISKNEERNILIAENVFRNRNRFNLVLSNRIEHLENLVRIYSEMSDDYELVVGKVKIVQRNEIISNMLDGKLHVIFATQLADEGLDIPNLDTIHLVYPTQADGVTEQRIGRIQRKKETLPIVYDYVDFAVPKFYHFAQNRMRLYTQLELELNMEDEDGKSKKSKEDSKKKRQSSLPIGLANRRKIKIRPRSDSTVR